MSFSASAWALRCPLAGPTKSVLLVLAIHANQEEACWPSIDTIAREAGVSDRSAQVAIRDMEKAGLIVSEGQGGRRLTKKYVLQVQIELTEPLPKRVQVVREMVQVVHKRVQESAQKGAGPSPKPLREPSKEPSENLPPIVPTLELSGEPSPKRVLVNGNAVAFEAWWKSYPNKKSKGHAEAAYAKALAITDHATLLAALDRPWGNRKYIPHPATWLNRKCWLDEIGRHDPVLAAFGLDPDGKLPPEPFGFLT